MILVLAEKIQEYQELKKIVLKFLVAHIVYWHIIWLPILLLFLFKEKRVNVQMTNNALCSLNPRLSGTSILLIHFLFISHFLIKKKIILVR